MNWQTKRDVAQMGIEKGVIDNGIAPDESFYTEILNKDYSNLSTRETLAVNYAISMGNKPKELSKDDNFWDEMKKVFTDEEITDLTYCIAGWMGMGRVAHVLGLDQNCSI